MPSITTTANGYGRAFANTILAALKTAPADPLIDAAKLRLSQDPAYNPTPSATIAALEAQEADYSGYTAGGYAVVVPNPVNLSGSAQGVFLSQLLTATTATPFVDNVLYGWWVDDGANVIAYGRFNQDNPPGMGQPGDFIDLGVSLCMMLNQTS